MNSVPEVVWNEEVMAVGTHYSNAIRVSASNGHCSLEIESSAGSTALTFEVSNDGTNWHVPVDVNDTDLDAIFAALGAESKFISFDPAVAKWMRIKAVVSGAETTISASLTQVKDRWS